MWLVGCNGFKEYQLSPFEFLYASVVTTFTLLGVAVCSHFP